MKWAELITIGTPIIVALLALGGTLWGKSLSRKTDAATARKTEAEAVKTDVETARSLVAEIRSMYEHQKNLNQEQRVDYEKRLSSTQGELTNLAKFVRNVEVRQAALIAGLAAHQPWDFAAYEALRASFDNFPPPPPLDPGPLVNLRNHRRDDAEHRRRQDIHEAANDGIDDSYGM